MRKMIGFIVYSAELVLDKKGREIFSVFFGGVLSFVQGVELNNDEDKWMLKGSFL